MKYLLALLIGLLLLRSLIPRKKLKPKEREGRAELLSKDPVCGLYVPENNSLSMTKGDKTYYFCSKECMRTFSTRRG